MQRSNGYILIYTIILTVVCGVVLSSTAMGLKERQTTNIEVEQKMNILSTVMSIEGLERQQALTIYDKRVKGYVVNFNGDVLENEDVTKVDVVKEYKKPLEQRVFPVYEIKSETNTDQTEFYVVPVYGFGLWNNISGYVSLKSDLNTINGVTFGHVGETPGLGARITDDPEVPARYVGKKLFDNGELKAVIMQKGEGNDYSDQPHKVDGMSGATLTAKGVNDMMTDYFTAYQNYFKKIKK